MSSWGLACSPNVLIPDLPVVLQTPGFMVLGAPCGHRSAVSIRPPFLAGTLANTAVPLAGVTWGPTLQSADCDSSGSVPRDCTAGPSQSPF